MERKLIWLHVWNDDTVTHVSIQRGERHKIYRPSRGLVKWLSGVASNLEARKCGFFVPSIAGLGWSWQPNREAS